MDTSNTEDLLKIELPAGTYDVVVHLIGWDDEPGMELDGGGPAEGALPDFIVTLVPSSTDNHRLSLDTFERRK